MGQNEKFNFKILGIYVFVNVMLCSCLSLCNFGHHMTIFNVSLHKK